MFYYLEKLKKEWPILAFSFLLVTLSIAAGMSSAKLFTRSVQLQMLSAVLGYGVGVSLFSRLFRLCAQRMVVCALFYGGGGYFLGMALAVLGCFALFSAYGCAWSCIFGGLSGLKTLLGIAVFLMHILLQTLAVSTLLLGGVRRVRQQIIERHIPKSSVDLARESIPHLKSCGKSLAYWSVCALVEAVLLEGIFELLEYTLF